MHLDLVIPISIGKDKTMWHKIGTVFKNEKEDKKHLMTVSIRSIPLKAYVDGEIVAYVFPPKEDSSKTKSPPPIDDFGFDEPF